MSMLQAQCDKLRERAATLRQGRWSDGADDARLMEDAADTIWELRDDLQRANAKNAKLRKLVVLGIMLPLNEEQLDLLDKTFVSELGEGLYVQLENLGIEVTK